MSEETKDVHLLLTQLLKAIIDHPEDLRIETKEFQGRIEWRVRVHIDDQGKVIGKKGAHIKALQFLYYKNVSTILVHPFCQFGQDGTGAMSLYKKDKTFFIRTAGDHFWDVYNVIKNGFEPIDSGVKGMNQSVIVTGESSYEIVEN